MNRVKYITSNLYVKFIHKIFKAKEITILDIGSGNHAALRLKKRLPNVKYYGLDINKNYNNSVADFEVMEEFYEMDLTHLEFDAIPDAHFDFVIMSHIIEHLYNGEEVVAKLLNKIKEGGYLYIEWPSKKSAYLPSMKGTLNFFDDNTHVRFYDQHLLANELMKRGCRISKMGRKRDFWMMAIMPFNFIRQMMKGNIKADLFWDYMGFADMILCQKLIITDKKP